MAPVPLLDAPSRTSPAPRLAGRRRARRRAGRASLALLLLVAFAPALAAQEGIGKLLGSGGGQAVHVDDAEPMIVRARDAFERAATRRVDEALAQHEELHGRTDGYVADAAQSFADTARVRLETAEGDGVLTLSEVSDVLGALREEALGQLDGRLDAARDGAPPPPRPAPDETSADHARRLAEYTFLERNPPWIWLVVLGLALGGVVVAALIAYGARRMGSRLRKLKHGRLAGELAATTSGPMYLALGLAGVSVSRQWVWIPHQASSFVDTVLRALFLLAGFWLMWNLCAVAATAVRLALVRTPEAEDDGHADLIGKGLRVVLIVATIMFGAEFLLDTEASTVLAGLGIAALAVSLAAQDTLRNLLGWLTIAVDKPFHAGQYLDHDGHFGAVERIGFRGTQLRTWDGHLITVPNAELVKSTIDNVGARPFIRRRFRIDLEYDTPADKMREAAEIAMDVLSGHDWEPESQPPRVAFDEFGEHSLRLLVQYCYQPPDYWEAKANDQQVNLAILRRFREAGLRFAYPTRALVHRSDPDDALLVQVTSTASGEDPEDEPDEDVDEALDEDEDEDGEEETPAKASSNGTSGRSRKRKARSSR